MGPTASGKTGKAVALARALNTEIISGDSRQVYRDMNLGTGKDLDEYDGIRYHLIDIADAGNKYDLYQYIRDFDIAYTDILSRGMMPLICGGSGLYVETAISGVRLPNVPVNQPLRDSLRDLPLEKLTAMLSSMKRLHNTTDVDTCQRAIRAIEICEHYRLHPQEAALADRSCAKPLDTLLIVLDIDRDERRHRISERLKARLEAGMIDEIRQLLDSGISPDNLIYYGLEYKYITMYVIGKLSYDEMFKQLEIAIHQFAKRQMTWLRGMERRGFKLHLLPYNLSDEEFVSEVMLLLQK